MLVLLAALVTLAQGPFVERLSVDQAGLQATGASGWPSLSADGRFVAFQSDAILVPSDTNGLTDIYLRDRLAGTIELVSRDHAGGPASERCLAPRISDDGQRVVFYSTATDLTPDPDSNGTFDVFLRDRAAGTTTLVSLALGGGTGDSYSFFPDISGDGRYVAFESQADDLAPGDAPLLRDVFRRDLLLGTTELVSVGVGGSVPNGASLKPSISGDGRWVAFESAASNLGPSDTGPTMDIYVRDLVAGTTVLASLKSTGGQSIIGSRTPSISSDGTVVAFEGSGLVPNDTNGATDVHLRNLTMGTTKRVSTDGIGRQGNGYSIDPRVSADGRLVAFASVAQNLLIDDASPWPYKQIYVKDTHYGSIYLVSAKPNALLGGQASGLPAISADGSLVVFDSYASDLVPGDTNGAQDVFLGELPVAGARLRLVQQNPGDPMSLELGNASPHSAVLVGFCFDDQGPLATPFGLVNVGPAFGTLLLATDGAGEANLSVQVPGLLGRILFAQGLDLGDGELSNADCRLIR